MSSFIERREELTKVRTALKKISLKNRKKHLIKIINMLRDKLFDKIDAFETFFLLQRLNVLLSTLIVKKQIVLTLKKINNKLKNLEKTQRKLSLFYRFTQAWRRQKARETSISQLSRLRHTTTLISNDSSRTRKEKRE
jgi:hypothetical protein